MKRTIRLAAVVGGCLLLAAGAWAARQDAEELGRKIAERMRGAMEDPAAMQRWQESMRTGDEHRYLQEAFVGTWETEMKMWMDPQGEPMTTRGRAEVEPLMDGRFVRERFNAEVMGQPFTGESTTGFDNNKKQFITVWLDSMSTGVTTMKGSISQDGKTLTFVGDMDEPMSGEMAKAFMMVTTMEGPDRHRMEMFEILYGERIKVMEVTYTRAGE